MLDLDLVAVFSVIPAGFWCRLSEKKKKKKKHRRGKSHSHQKGKSNFMEIKTQFLRRRGTDSGGWDCKG